MAQQQQYGSSLPSFLTGMSQELDRQTSLNYRMKAGKEQLKANWDDDYKWADTIAQEFSSSEPKETSIVQQTTATPEAEEVMPAKPAYTSGFVSDNRDLDKLASKGKASITSINVSPVQYTNTGADHSSITEYYKTPESTGYGQLGRAMNNNKSVAPWVTLAKSSGLNISSPKFLETILEDPDKRGLYPSQRKAFYNWEKTQTLSRAMTPAREAKTPNYWSNLQSVINRRK